MEDGMDFLALILSWLNDLNMLFLILFLVFIFVFVKENQSIIRNRIAYLS